LITVAEGASRPLVQRRRARRILADLDLKLHKVRGWLTRRDTPAFWQRAEHICNLYRNPPQGAVLLSIDEKTAIAALSRVKTRVRAPDQGVSLRDGGGPGHDRDPCGGHGSIC
jgi:hypothetical protein